MESHIPWIGGVAWGLEAYLPFMRIFFAHRRARWLQELFPPDIDDPAGL